MQSRNLLPRLQSSKWYSSNSSGKGLNGEPQQALSLQAFFDYAHDLAVSGSLQSDGVNVRGVAKLMSECRFLTDCRICCPCCVGHVSPQGALHVLELNVQVSCPCQSWACGKALSG